MIAPLPGKSLISRSSVSIAAVCRLLPGSQGEMVFAPSLSKGAMSAMLRLIERGGQLVIERDEIEQSLQAIDEVCAMFARKGMLNRLVDERRPNGAREARLARS